MLVLYYINSYGISKNSSSSKIAILIIIFSCYNINKQLLKTRTAKGALSKIKKNNNIGYNFMLTI